MDSRELTQIRKALIQLKKDMIEAEEAWYDKQRGSAWAYGYLKASAESAVYRLESLLPGTSDDLPGR